MLDWRCEENNHLLDERKRPLVRPMRAAGGTVRRTRRHFTITPVAVTFAAVGGCGGGSAGRTTPAKTPLTERVSQRVVAKDRATGERALMRESDFPGEFVGGLKEEEDSLSPTDLLRKAATSCLRLNISVLANMDPATVTSQKFEESADEGAKGGYIDIQNTVTVEPTVAAASEWFSILDRPQAPSCIGEAFRNAILEESPGLRKSGNAVGKARVGQMAFPWYGDQSVAYRLIVPIVAEGHNLSTYPDYVLVRKGRAHTTSAFRRVGTAVGSKMEQRLIVLTTRRLRP
jgi:hypothetical protein